jgi:pyruvate ferredoxin oxidoreductase delta subunit
MAKTSLEVVYRGIFQKTLARNICRGIILAAVKEGKVGIGFGRYGDSPERNGIPAKYFAVIADSQEELEENLATYEAANVDVTVSVDDTLCKGVESWGWYGLQPINQLTKENGTLLVTSVHGRNDLIRDTHTKDVSYNLGVVQGSVSFSGLWVYKDDHTDVRVMGAICKVCPEMVSIESVEAAIKEQWDNPVKVESARKSYERTETRVVEPGTGNSEVPFSFDLPGWTTMEEGLVIRNVEQGKGFRGGEEGYEPVRNPYFKKWSTRSMRPVINFETCIKCTLCWLHCPDTCFDVTPDGLYDSNMESCCGCAVCEAVCPVPECIIMVNESEFEGNDSQWEAWQKDKDGYTKWMTELVEKQKTETPRSHGFHHVGQYQEEVGAAVDTQSQVGGL